MRKSGNFILPAIAALLLCVTRAIGAPQPASNDVNTVRAKYEANVKGVELACAQQKTDAFVTYGKSLDAKLKAMKQAGDFDGYIAIEKAKKEYAQNIVIPELADVKNAVLLEIVNQYYKSVESADADKPKKMAALQDRYMGVLQDNIKRLTMQDNLVDAGRFAVELETIKAARAADAPPAASTKPENTATPETEKKMVMHETITTRIISTGSESAKPGQTERTVVTSISRPAGHFGTPVPRISETYKAKSSGALELWRPTAIKVKNGDWATIKVVSTAKNTMVSFQRSDQRNRHDAIVTFKTKGGESCAATEDKPGYFHVTEDSELSCLCMGDMDVVASITTTSGDPRESVWIPDN